jgi:hypothetical protein
LFRAGGVEAPTCHSHTRSAWLRPVAPPVRAVVQVLELNAADEGMLLSCVEAIAMSDGGADVLYHVLADAGSAGGAGGAGYATEVVRVMSSLQVRAGSPPPSPHTQSHTQSH